MRVIVAGATGLLGQGVLHECLASPQVSHVAALVRRPTGIVDARLEDVVVADFGQLDAVEEQLHPYDACLYCAGAIPLGMSETQYRHVTVDLTLNVARTLARLNPAMKFLYVSGAFSNPDSVVMPLRVKGQAEHALGQLPILTVMLRTGGIQPAHGERSPHAAMAAFYAVAAPVMGLGVKLAPAMLTSTGAVGKAMLALLRQSNPPVVVENATINSLATNADTTR